MWRVAIFPTNGLDRSLHAPILVGLVLVTFLAEAFGWTYAGLVVPGYLAAVAAAAPLTCALITLEAVVTYLLVAAVGVWIPKTSAWSTTFGRERFFLFIVVAVLVRVAFEGYLVPEVMARWSFAHSRELYSVGLVLVPLYANVFWQSGVRAALPRLAVISGLTYAFVELVLVRHTNFSLSRLLVANESGMAEFLASPKAQMILVLGAMLGARGNVLYGWDYNGILVPGLLAVAWYQPTKLAATVAESLVIYGLSVAMTRLPPLSRVLIVGSRRMLLAFGVGFFAKVALGFAIARWAPRVQLVDYLGYGYLLPSLLAVKMWNKAKIGVVLLPTLQVSLTAFVLGNAIGFGIAWAGTLRMSNLAASAPDSSSSAAVTLLLGDTAPDPRRGYTGWSARDVTSTLLGLVRSAREGGAISPAALRHAEDAGMHVVQAEGGRWLVAVPRAVEVDRAGGLAAPRIALRASSSSATGAWIVVVRSPAPGSSAIPAALRVAETIDAAAVVVISRHAALARSDVASVDAVARALSTERILLVEPGADVDTLDVVGALPEGLGLDRMSRSVGRPVVVAWRSPATGALLFPDAPRLRLSDDAANEMGASVLGALPVESWDGDALRQLAARSVALTSTGPRGFRAPPASELRLFASILGPLLDGGVPESGPSSWARAVMARLGYRFARAADGSSGTPRWIVFEPPGAERAGNPTFVLGPAAARGALLLEVPAPRWEIGTLAGALGLTELLHAGGLLVAGALPHDDPRGAADPRRYAGRHSYYQLVHERWLEAGGHALSLQGIAPDQTRTDDVVLSVGRELDDASFEPPWLKGVRDGFETVGQSVADFDGTRARAAFGGAADPTMAFAERFARDAYAIAWLASGPRSRLASAEASERLATAIGRTHAIADGDVAVRAMETVATTRTERCDFDKAIEDWRRFAREGNPLDIEGAGTGYGCYVSLLRDEPTGLVWAIVAKKGEARVVPVGVPVTATSKVLRDAEALRRAMWMRLAVLRVEQSP